jgi:hypothetical protein
VANKHFIGLVHSVLSSAEAALGETHSPMTRQLLRDGVLARRTAEKSLELLIMLQEKTQGNLDETERDALLSAQATIRARLQALERGAELN